ncbi:hypothetical protein ETU10_01180 [Apibacter muscae]|uniref:Uncharacterized protein n=1 Tax=Apibacter muscae TaxID=2509004 RepID=A0A563DLI6_9FLAO|nr:hypothetical protein [Apibacter muscae]TWP25275.1 hypothetical protein ETU10_01180 [Apibacter muscae]TWP30811.1 hypothetical protein ETU09_00150 [Apibacter muscae]
MKKIQLIISFIALSFFVVIAKNTFFTDDNIKFYNQGLDAYKKGNYQAAITFFNWVNSEEYPNVLIPLADSYLMINDFENAIQNFEKVYKSNIAVNTENYPGILNNLGFCYMRIGNLKEARFFLEKSYNMGNSVSENNLQILDSLEYRNN